MTRIWRGYLAGPMTVAYKAGRKDWNYGEFNRIADLLAEGGHDMHNPAGHFGGDTTRPRADYIREAIKAVMDSDYIVLIPGWEKSPGANLELDVAIELGLDIYEFIEEDDGFWYLRPLAVRRRPTRSIP